MQGFIFTATEKCTLVLEVKGTRSWCVLEECVKPNTMQSFIVAAINATEYCILILDLT